MTAQIELPLSCFEEVFRWYPDMRGHVKTWCDENLQAHPHFLMTTYTTPSKYYGNFVTDADATFFMLRWVG
jgi:hypothetical protein